MSHRQDRSSRITLIHLFSILCSLTIIITAVTADSLHSHHPNARHALLGVAAAHQKPGFKLQRRSHDRLSIVTRDREGMSGLVRVLDSATIKPTSSKPQPPTKTIFVSNSTQTVLPSNNNSGTQRIAKMIVEEILLTIETKAVGNGVLETVTCKVIVFHDGRKTSRHRECESTLSNSFDSSLTGAVTTQNDETSRETASASTRSTATAGLALTPLIIATTTTQSSSTSSSTVTSASVTTISTATTSIETSDDSDIPASTALATNPTPTTPADPAAAASSSSAEAVQQAQQSAAQSFVLPGQKLSVLPIGLGIFAGIAVLGLGIFGAVTWERKKYRDQFRKRRLADQVLAGAGLGRFHNDGMQEVHL